MIGAKMQKAVNNQIKNELDSAYLYLSMAAYFHSLNLDGMANWMHVQSKEELFHVSKFFDHIKDRDGKIELAALNKPKARWASPLEAWEDAYDHEVAITKTIHALVKLAQAEADYAALPLLNWFEDEQIEEESSTFKVAQKLKLIGPSGAGLVMLDKQLAKRTFESSK